ncbi:response regulator [Nguyenibacter sp. L1]|uniref:response regulator n=1 Tax=Nguyenibacter sp. L1 TaxID=3049350 RepID=UPI002B46BAC1|nr:response regulator [Nguyenibacter sp. L1]WRH87807.1 response regulator [Nguyenibacter sp. L1]
MTSPRHVLLVEDESAIAELIRTALDAAGLRVTACPGVQTAGRALGQAGKDRIDLAILDLTLPDGPPDPLARRLDDAGIPVIAISGDPDRLTAFPVAYRLEKPFRIRALMELVTTALPG